MRDGLLHLIRQETDLSVCGHAPDMDDLFPLLRELRPDLLLLDVRLKKGHPLQGIARVKAGFPALRILILSQFDETIYAERILRAGAHGYIMKEEASREVLSAIRTVLDGGIYLSRRMAWRLAHRFEGMPVYPPPAALKKYLTSRELQIIQLIGAGLSTRDIARALGLSLKTVESYRERAGQKLGLGGTMDLLRFASQIVEDVTTITIPAGEISVSRRMHHSH